VREAQQAPTAAGTVTPPDHHRALGWIDKREVCEFLARCARARSICERLSRTAEPCKDCDDALLNGHLAARSGAHKLAQTLDNHALALMDAPGKHGRLLIHCLTLVLHQTDLPRRVRLCNEHTSERWSCGLTSDPE
jgi:hypothetical protein